jgi:predicted AlkP superfamily pyrophosphatase or phosphodiesterase
MKQRSTATEHLIVISMDGLSEAERATISGLPHFSALLARGSAIGSIESVYPSLTYVVHATMITGRYPDGHGIDHNCPLQPGIAAGRQRWYWYAHQIRCPTLFDLARTAGYTTSAVLWPVVAGARIDWNLPEIVALPGENQTLKALRAGSAWYLLELAALFGRYRKGKTQPWLDDFVSRCAAHTIRTRRPGLLMTHLIALDDAKHHHGSAASATRDALISLDTNLGRIVQAVDSAGLTRTTTIVVLGDHGHIDISRRVRLNHLLSKTRSAWFRCAGGSAYLHVQPEEPGQAAQAMASLAEAASDASLGIAAIHSGPALADLRCASGAICAVDAHPGTQFREDLDGPLLELASSPETFGADHGYPPWTTGYRSLFMAAGPGIIRGSDPGHFAMVDVAPTLARLLGLDAAAAAAGVTFDGIPVESILQ